MATYKATATVWIKEYADTASSNVGSVTEGSTVEVTSVSGGWYQVSSGYIYAAEGELTATDTDSTTTIDSSSAATAVATAAVSSDSSQADTGDSDTISSNFQTVMSGLNISNLRGIMGMPYQYMDIADTRISSTSSTSFGRKYAEKIVARMPLLVMVPGTPEFMSAYSDTQKQSIIQYMLSSSGSTTSSDLDSLLSKCGRYYNLKRNWTDYYNCVNPMLRAAAIFLNIHNKTLDGTALGSYDWSKLNNDQIAKYLDFKGGLAFYVNSETQISTSFSNSSAESQLASKVNGISEMGRELNFLLGGAGALTGMEFDKYSKQENLDKNIANAKDMSKRILNGNNLISSITGGLQTVFAGGKLMFPEIWSDSQYSRDYQISLKLASPDCDNFSIYMNIIVPILHLVGLCAPRQAGPNGFISPFLVRAYYRGLFSCGMGLITNMTINAGAEGSWTRSGLPTVAEVSFSIKDLYSALAISNSGNLSTGQGILSNIALMDYIGTMCGVNVNQTDVTRLITMYYLYNKNKVADFWKNDICNGLDQWATNKILNLWGTQ